MRENNDMEILMQLKMEAFRMEPAPSDWLAIYEQLHPKKRKRFIWWWLPLAAGLSLFGAYWLIFEGQNKSTPDQPQPIAEIRSTLPSSRPQDSTQAVPAITDPKAGEANKGSVSVIADQRRTENLAGSGSPALSRSSQVAGTDLKTPKAQAPGEAGSRRTTDPGKSAYFASTEPASSQNKPKENLVTPIEPEVPVTPGTITGSRSETSVMRTDTLMLEKVPGTKPEDQQIPADSLSQSAAASTQKETAPDQTTTAGSETDSVRSDEPATAPAAKTSSIPRLSNHTEKGWYLGLYGGFGVNDPTKAMTMTKSADLISAPSSGNSFTTVDNKDNSGLHFAFGLAIERKMKKMSLSTGLGLQLNSWSSNRTIYKDSIFPGSFFNRTLIGNSTVNYSHLAIEIPLIMNFKIAGKKQNSYWLNLGLNNAITLKLDRKSEPTVTLGNNSFSLDNTPADPSTYQPQLRLGLMYENAQEGSHFQISPFMQYGLNNMTRSGTPDVQMLHFGLLGRYYFKKLR
jgi:hypothetical protein